MTILGLLEKERIPKPTAKSNPNPYRWSHNTVMHILEMPEYAGHTANFKTHRKSYKCKKKVDNDRSEWMIFENTHEPIVSQHDFDLVQEIRKGKRVIQKHGRMNLLSGMVYCSDCGSRLYLCRAVGQPDIHEHLKCRRYAKDKTDCSAHYIRTCVLTEIVLSELNRMLEVVRANEEQFIKTAMENSTESYLSELKKARKALIRSEKRIAELDHLYLRIYEDHASGKLSDERFEMMSASYEEEQGKLKQTSAVIETKQQKSADTTQFLNIVRKYTEITELTPEIMHELIEKIVVYAPDKSSGHRTQQIDIHYRFNVAVSTVVADRNKQKAA